MEAQAHTNGNGHALAVAPPPIAPVAQIPASIVVACCQIQTTVEAIRKSHKNQHGGYMFASTDDIYAGLTRKMGEVGLMCLAMEDRDVEIIRVEKEGKTSQWAKFVFSFVLATKDATWTDPRNRRTLYIQITGPQTFQAANSYAEKSYLKSLFKLPTGEMDLDSMPQAETEEDQIALQSIGKTKRKSSASAKKDGTTAVFNELDASLNAAEGPAELKAIWVKNAEVLACLPSRWFQLLAETYTVKMGEHGLEVEVEDQATMRAQL